MILVNWFTLWILAVICFIISIVNFIAGHAKPGVFTLGLALLCGIIGYIMYRRD